MWTCWYVWSPFRFLLHTWPSQSWNKTKKGIKKVQQSAEHRGGSYLMFFFYDNQMISSQFLLSSELTLSQTLLYQHLSFPNKDNMKWMSNCKENLSLARKHVLNLIKRTWPFLSWDWIASYCSWTTKQKELSVLTTKLFRITKNIERKMRFVWSMEYIFWELAVTRTSIGHFQTISCNN